MSDIKVSLCVTAYNRPVLLKECVRSFFQTSLYDRDKLELIIVDNGSTNSEIIEFIRTLDPPCKEYSYILNEKNDFPTCLKYAKVQARGKAKGNYFIDCPDDHLFLVKSDWISESIEHIDSATNVGCVIHFAYPAYRLRKPNNAMRPHVLSDSFYESLYKGYADYHLMSKKIYKEVGEINYDLEKQSLGEAEKDYMRRTLELGYRRNMMKYPVAAINDDASSGMKIEGYELIQPFSKEELVDPFKNLQRPICNEELVSFAIQNNKIKKIENFQKVY